MASPDSSTCPFFQVPDPPFQTSNYAQASGGAQGQSQCPLDTDQFSL